MAINKNHDTHQKMLAAFESTESNIPRSQPGQGRISYGMGAKGLPRTPAQQASVRKAAAASASARANRDLGAAGLETGPVTSPRAPVTAGPAAKAAGPLKPPPGISTGGLSLVKKKGLLSI